MINYIFVSNDSRVLPEIPGTEILVPGIPGTQFNGPKSQKRYRDQSTKNPGFRPVYQSRELHSLYSIDLAIFTHPVSLISCGIPQRIDCFQSTCINSYIRNTYHK